MTKYVLYHDIPCQLLEAEAPFPARVQILWPQDIQRAQEAGFICWGFPAEMAKELTEDEYDCLHRFGRFPLTERNE